MRGESRAPGLGAWPDRRAWPEGREGPGWGGAWGGGEPGGRGGSSANGPAGGRVPAGEPPGALEGGERAAAASAGSSPAGETPSPPRLMLRAARRAPAGPPGPPRGAVTRRRLGRRPAVRASRWGTGNPARAGPGRARAARVPQGDPGQQRALGGRGLTWPL